MSFKELRSDSALTLVTIDYSYDKLSRLLSADYDNGATVYQYGYDVAGNLVNNNGTTRTYNAANQMTNDGTNSLTYDSNGNLTSDGVNSYTWDRANRLLSHGGISYAYDGAGNRISQDTLKYLLDVQPGLTVVLGDSDGNHFVHGVRGIHAVEDNAGNWEYMAQDGLGSVRSLVDDAAAVQSSMSYDPYGNPMGSYGAGFGFTGEQVDDNDLVFLRARYMNPNIGTFLSLDPFEGVQNRPMSLNGYSYVGGDAINRTDPSGLCWANSDASPEQQGQCYDAWTAYMAVISEQYTNDWPRDIRKLVTEEAGYWGFISYDEFVTQWNSSIIQPTRSTPGNDLMAIGLPVSGGISQITPAVPGPDDAVAGIALLCVAALSVVMNATAIALPQRQAWDFSQSDASEGDDAIPIPWPVRPTWDRQKIVLYRAIASAELEFVRGASFRSYGFSPSGGGKYFAITEIGARAFANSSINVGINAIAAITKVRISPEVAILGYYFLDVGEYGAGPSVHFSDANLAIMYADILVSNERIVII